MKSKKVSKAKPKTKPSKRSSVRLHPSVTPIHYKLTLAPDLDAHTFYGKEVITIELQKSSKTITLHSKDLNIDNAKIVFDKKISLFATIKYDDKKEVAIFTFKKSIPKGKARIELEFRGVLSDTLRGFYKSKYTHEGVDKILATTQFEATDARRAFPCFDEPAHKAVFDVSLIVPSDKMAISNTLPIATREHSPGYQVIDFAPTPKMSTYLLAFIIGDFEHIERKTKSGVKVRVFTTPGKKGQAKFALDVTVRCLEFYESYFGIPYPLNTLDTIAIPDFEAGAMENWGAITYRESALLVDDENSSLSSKQWAAIVICHELAHQWFGNLVTMEWWTDLWLNEGFASYIEYLAADKLFPEWKLWEQFVAIDHAIALRLDALATTHPIEVDVHDPSEISEIFDEISYQKGAAVIRMLAEYLGPDKFREGLSYYLKKHSYKNTSTVHLWEAFEKVSHMPVKEMMKKWTGYSGHPLVKVSETKDGYIFTQERFFRSPLSKKSNIENNVWPIPLSVCIGSESEKIDMLMDKHSLKIRMVRSEGGADSWLKVNKDEVGVYRTLYTPELLEKLFIAVKDRQLTSEDRLGIVRDLFALAETGDYAMKDILEFLSAYKDEDSYIVWSEIISGLYRVKNLYHKKDWMKGFDEYAKSLLLSVVKKVGFKKKDGEPHSATLMRSLVLSAAAHFGMGAVVIHAKKVFASGGVHPDIRGFVYSTYAKHGNDAAYKKMINMYKNETLHEERNRIGNALGHFKDPVLLRQTLEFALSSHVRPQDAPSMIASVWSNHTGKELAWKYVKKNWDTLLKRYGNGGHSLGRIVGPAKNFSDEKSAKDFERFMSVHAHPGIDRTITQILEGIRSNDTWRRREEKSMKTFCRRYL